MFSPSDQFRGLNQLLLNITVVWTIFYYFELFVFNATFNNISVLSWRSVVLLLWESQVPEEKNGLSTNVITLMFI